MVRQLNVANAAFLLNWLHVHSFTLSRREVGRWNDFEVFSAISLGRQGTVVSEQHLVVGVAEHRDGLGGVFVKGVMIGTCRMPEGIVWPRGDSSGGLQSSPTFTIRENREVFWPKI